MILSSTNRSSQHRRIALLKILAVAHDQRLDPAVLVHNLAMEHFGIYRRRLIRFAECLSSGTDVPSALEQNPWLVNRHATLAIRFAYQTGTTNQVYQQLSQMRFGKEIQPEFDRPTHMMAQAIASLIIAIAVMCFMAIYIFPVIGQIKEDCGIESPALESVLGCVQWLTEYWPWGLLSVAFLIAVYYSRPIRKCVNGLFSERGGTDSQQAEILRMLSTACEAGRPIESAISTLGRYHYDAKTRQELLWVRNEIEQGRDAWESLGESSLMKLSESQGVASLDDGPVRVWALQALADKQAGAQSWRFTTVIELAPIVVLLVVAGLVTWLGYAMLQFLNNLMGAV